VSLIKHKKYQYLYLKNKIELKWDSLEWFYNEGYDLRSEEERLHHLGDWLTRIGLKYGYDKNQKKATIYQEALQDREYQQTLKERKNDNRLTS